MTWANPGPPAWSSERRASRTSAVNRSIVGFHRDDESHWVAELDCGHDQHVRHDPPLVERPWVLDDASRAARVGATLPCPLCARLELPAKARPYKRTAHFRAATIPAGLLASHTTKAGVWGRIEVVAGRLLYTVHAPIGQSFVLAPGAPGIVAPGISHEVAPAGDEGEFFVEFMRVDR